MFSSSKMTVYPSSKCPTFLAAMDELSVHTWKCKFGLVAGMDKQSVHSGLKYFDHKKHGQTVRPLSFVQILIPLKLMDKQSIHPSVTM